MGAAVRARGAVRGGAGSLLPPRRARAQREPGAAGAGQAQRLRGRAGADALGWSGDFIFRNAKGCVGSGVCASLAARRQRSSTWGRPTCPRPGTRGRSRTWAARRIVVGRAGRGGVEAVTSGGGRVRVQCDTVVVACGTIHTPLPLRANRLGLDSGELGRNLAIHPATAVRAEFDEEIDMARGVPQSFYIDELRRRGDHVRGRRRPAGTTWRCRSLSRERHRELMLRFKRLSQFGVMVSDRRAASCAAAAGAWRSATTSSTRISSSSGADHPARRALLGGRRQAGCSARRRIRRADVARSAATTRRAFGPPT